LSTTLSKIWLSVGPIFTVLPITLSFLTRFRPVKYLIEALEVLYPMVRRWLAQSSFWSGQRLGQISVKLGQSWSNLPKLREMCYGPRFEILLMRWAPVGLDWLDPGCFILRADTRENPRGKNRVMTPMIKFHHFIVYYIVNIVHFFPFFPCDLGVKIPIGCDGLCKTSMGR
jgi:hypothetical protein